MSTQQGEVLAERYRLLELLGRGGMGVVWHAFDELLGRDVAVKEVVLPAGLTAQEREVQFLRTLREARAAGRLSHPNVVTVFDVVDDGGRPWIVMEFVRSRSLAQVLQERGPLPVAEVAELGLHVLDALTAAHAAGILHRDVKPSNVLLGERGRVVLTDFGIATFEGDAALTWSGLLIGSPAYIAPERALGLRTGRESDLWSLGATLYAAVEGRPPFDREGAVPMLAAVATADPDPPVRAGPLAAVLDGLLRKDPADRLGAGEAARLLRGVLTDPDQHSPAQPPAVGPAGPAATEQPRPVAPPALQQRTPVDGPVRSAVPAGEGGSPVGARPAGLARRFWPLLVLAVIGLLVAVGSLVPGWLDEQDRTGPRAPSVSPSAPATGAPSQPTAARTSPGATPSPTIAAAPAAPRGFHRYRDRTGFSLAIPDGWLVTRREHYVYVREPNGTRFLLIDQTDQPKADAKADWQRQEAARRDEIRDYRRIRIDSVAYQLEAADWEFTHTGADGTPLHVLSRGFVTSKSQAYGLYWSTPQRQWHASLSYFDSFTATFSPRR